MLPHSYRAHWLLWSLKIMATQKRDSKRGILCKVKMKLFYTSDGSNESRKDCTYRKTELVDWKNRMCMAICCVSTMLYIHSSMAVYGSHLPKLTNHLGQYISQVHFILSPYPICCSFAIAIRVSAVTRHNPRDRTTACHHLTLTWTSAAAHYLPGRCSILTMTTLFSPWSHSIVVKAALLNDEVNKVQPNCWSSTSALIGLHFTVWISCLIKKICASNVIWTIASTKMPTSHSGCTGSDHFSRSHQQIVHSWHDIWMQSIMSFVVIFARCHELPTLVYLPLLAPHRL